MPDILGNLVAAHIYLGNFEEAKEVCRDAFLFFNDVISDRRREMYSAILSLPKELTIEHMRTLPEGYEDREDLLIPEFQTGFQNVKKPGKKGEDVYKGGGKKGKRGKQKASGLGLEGLHRQGVENFQAAGMGELAGLTEMGKDPLKRFKEKLPLFAPAAPTDNNQDRRPRPGFSEWGGNTYV